MKENDAALGSFRNRLLHPCKIKTLCGFREVGVGCDGYRGIREDLIVVGPGWVAEIDGVIAGVEFGEEERTQMHCSCARDGLDGTDALLSNRWRISAQNELCSGGSEGGQAENWEIFVVQGGVLAEDLICLDVHISSYCA